MVAFSAKIQVDKWDIFANFQTLWNGRVGELKATKKKPAENVPKDNNSSWLFTQSGGSSKNTIFCSLSFHSTSNFYFTYEIVQSSSTLS